MKEYTHYNRIKSVLAEKNKTGTWLSEQMGRNFGTAKVQKYIELSSETSDYQFVSF